MTLKIDYRLPRRYTYYVCAAYQASLGGPALGWFILIGLGAAAVRPSPRRRLPARLPDSQVPDSQVPARCPCCARARARAGAQRGGMGEVDLITIMTTRSVAVTEVPLGVCSFRPRVCGRHRHGRSATSAGAWPTTASRATRGWRTCCRSEASPPIAPPPLFPKLG
jgi:hypothetical protein